MHELQESAQAKAPFVAAVMIAAFLLFWLEPLVAKLLLPGLGGAPAVWAVCLVFFQSALLAGYGYAHVLQQRLPLRRQALVHLVVLLLAAATLPLRLDVSRGPAAGEEPTRWLLMQLVLCVAPVFVAAAATAPLLQRWFATSGRDPYSLYAASNLGSFGALLAFPFVLEPALDLDLQKQLWAAGFALLIVVTAVCARGTGGPSAGREVADTARPQASTLAPGSRRRWLALALVPSALLVAVTHHISTDVAAVPLLWVLPLSLYLLSFVNAFAARPWISPRVAGIASALTLALVATQRGLGLERPPLAFVVALHCAALFTASLALHGRLAALRPAPDRLSQFYLWLSFGGALGGVFAALLAPLVFETGFEYRLSLIAAAALLPGSWPVWRSSRAARAARPSAKRGKPKKPDAPVRVTTRADVLDVVGPLLIVVALVLSLFSTWVMSSFAWLAFAVMASGVLRPARVAATLALLFFAPLLSSGNEHVLFRSRNFFGTLVVYEQGQLRFLMHGTTQHGAQITAARNNFQPLAYYHPTGPIGQLLLAHRGSPLLRDVGVVGLGVGSLASYSSAGERWTFFEIDPAVIRVATDRRLFTLLDHAPAKTRIVQGDARLQLAHEPAAHFTLLVLDAFTSDAVPVHLLTREALALYRDKLAPGGVMMVHVSNRYLDLASVVARAARELGLPARIARDLDARGSHEGDWKLASEWVFIARDASATKWVERLAGWEEPSATAGRAWTDRHSNLWSALRH